MTDIGIDAELADPVTPPAEAVRGRNRAGRWLRDPVTMVAVLFLAFLAACALVPGLVAGGDPNGVDSAVSLQGPSGSHLLGTDQFGRDVFTRVVHGARISLLVGVLATLLGSVVGTLLGLVAGYLGRGVDAVAMWFTDVMLAFPGILFALAILAATGPGVRNVVLAIGVSGIPGYARVMRAQVLSVRERLYMEAARSSGSRTRTMLFGHVLPNAIGPVIVLATIGVGTSILAGSALSFLGLGPAPPSPEWGTMLADGRRFMSTSWWIPAFPGLFILLSVLSINVVGQTLRERVGQRER